MEAETKTTPTLSHRLTDEEWLSASKSRITTCRFSNSSLTDYGRVARHPFAFRPRAYSTSVKSLQPIMTLAAGSRLGPYDIVALIGEGGMGVVFQARDPRLDRQVAIKLPPALPADRQAQERLRCEAMAVAALVMFCLRTWRWCISVWAIANARWIALNRPTDPIRSGWDGSRTTVSSIRASLCCADEEAGIRQLNWEERPSLGGSGCQT